MVLDTNLLDRAREAAATLAEQEKQALMSRADYHAAVRRNHAKSQELGRCTRCHPGQARSARAGTHLSVGTMGPG